MGGGYISKWLKGLLPLAICLGISNAQYDTELSEVEGKNVCDGRLLQNNLPTGAEPWGFKVKRGKTSLADCQSYCKRRRTECQFMNWVEESQMCCIFKNCPNPSNYAGNQIHLKFFEVKVIGCASDANCGDGEKCVNGKCVEDKNCPWNYEDFSYWGSNDCWYTCGGGTNQEMGSPIDIVNIDNPSTADVDEKNTEDGTNLIMTDLDALGYKEEWGMTTSSSVDGEMQVIGYSLRFKIKTLTVSGDSSRTPGPLIRYNNMGVEDSYRLLHVDYKWGKDNTEGGEHQFDGKKFVLEAHYVHGNIKYQTAEDYQKHEDGILIIAVVFNLFDGTEISEPYFGDQTTWIKGVADKAKNLAKRRLNTNDATMPVTEAISMTNGAVFWRMLLTSLKDGHYSYKGSLTTPGCHEAVTWIVGRTELKVKSEDLAWFRMLIHDGSEIKRNWRPVQRIGGRKVKKMTTSWSGQPSSRNINIFT